MLNPVKLPDHTLIGWEWGCHLQLVMGATITARKMAGIAKGMFGTILQELNASLVYYH